MKYLLALVAMAVIATATVACRGGGDSMTLEEYFTEFERISNEAEARLDEVGTPDLGGNASFEASRDALANFYDRYATETEDVIDEFDGLDPPDEAAAEHERLVEAIGDLPSVTYVYANRIRDAESEAAFEAAFADTAEGEAVGQRITAACNALQAIAADNDVEVDLKCNE